MPDERATLRIRDLFDLPERVVKNDFVIRLHDGIQNEDVTLATYVPTPRIVNAFASVFTLIKKALESATSQGAYLHGSFGSGKSHFMAVLDLLLADRPGAWRRKEFHELRAAHGWIGQKKLLVLPVHCVNATALEDRIFEDYVAFVRTEHPEAPVPNVFRDREIFDMARAGIAQQGEETFLRILNQATSKKSGFAKAVAQKEGAWTRERIDAAMASTDTAVRRRLFDALVATHYPAFTKGGGHFLEIGPGLAALADHAKGLGYDGLFLLLDEVILWLSALKGDETRLLLECQKISTLIEPANHPRAIPIVSLLARQRDLRELLSESALGATWAAIEDQLERWKDRFDKIELPDSEFPQILRERVLRPKDDSAARAIEQAFEEKRRSLSTSEWDLLRGDYSEDDFRRVYPFSPALIDVLVRLSSALQRERTAMRIVTDLLVNHVGDQPVGSIVPLGDLYDLLAQEETRDQILNQRFHGARLAYRAQLLPAIQKKQGTTGADRCQRLREHHEPTIGCSGCPEQACRNDNRIAKTLILSALTPDVATVAQLDTRKLAQLNHGVIRSTLPSGAPARILSMVKDWATTASISIGTGENPQVALRLEAIDLAPLLARADVVDNYGARQGLLRRLLLQKLGLEAKESTFQHTIEWRGSRRTGQIQFANVRSLTLGAFEVPGDCEWQVVVDFPFDEKNRSPEEDRQRVEEFKERGNKAWTMVWLPSFFSEEMNDALGKLVRVVHIDEAPDDYLRVLSGPDRERAKNQIVELRRVLEQRVVAAIEAAYGVRSSAEAAALLDPSLSIAQHTYSLHDDARPAAFAKHSLEAAIEEQVDAILSARYPGHPFFKKPFTARSAGRVADVLGRAMEEKGNAVTVTDKADLVLMKEIAEPFLLAQVKDDRAVLQIDVLERVRNAAHRTGTDEPTVAQVAEWAEGDRPQGLQPVARDLLVDVYARFSKATLYEAERGAAGVERPIDPIPYGKLAPRAFLRVAELPSHEAWNKALALASTLWGTKLAGRGLNAKNVADLGLELNEQLARWTAAASLVSRLEDAWKSWGDTATCDRLTTARSAARLVDVMKDKAPIEIVNELASVTLETSPRAVQMSLNTAARIEAELTRPTTFSIFQLLRSRDEPWAKELLAGVAEALKCDEVVVPLEKRLQELTERATAQEGSRSRRAGRADTPSAPARRRQGALGAASLAACDAESARARERTRDDHRARPRAEARRAARRLEEGARLGPHDRRAVGVQGRVTTRAETIPVLTASALIELVRRARPSDDDRKRHPKRIAVLGTISNITTVTTDDGPYEVVPARSEMELRERLFGDRRDDATDGRIFVLSWPTAGATLPLDLRPLFAKGRVLRLIARERLEQRLGGRYVAEEVASSEIGQVLDAIPLERLPRYDAPTIDVAGAWRLYLGARVGLPIFTRPDGPSLLLWLLGAKGGAEFRREVRGRKQLPEELDRFLAREFGSLARTAWVAFEAERGRAFVVAGIVVQALLAAIKETPTLTPEERGAADLRIRQLQGEHSVPDDLLGTWAAESVDAIRDLDARGRRSESFDSRQLGTVDVATLLREADQRTDHLSDRLVARSDLLPRARVARLAALSRHASEVASAKATTADALETTRVLLADLKRHILVHESEPTFRAAQSLARLTSYLVCERRGTLRDSPGADATLKQWAAFQVQHGGALDRAVRELIAQHVPELASGAADVRRVVRDVRARANKAFAVRLQAFHLAGAPTEHDLGLLVDVGARSIAPFLDADPENRLCVLLLDGLSWGVAHELFESLGAVGWGPTQGNERSGEPTWPMPVLAALPSITAVSRSAFFAGHTPSPGTPEPHSDQDPNRWANHAALSRFKPELFLKKAIGTGSDLPTAVVDTIRDRSKRLVGVVVNAVDDWLSGPQQIAHGFGIEVVKPLRALLALCADVGRTILIASDHGHTVNEDLTLPEESLHSRWRLPSAKEPASDGELLFAGPKVWCPPGSSGVLLPFVSGATYTHKKVGHHGGATLEEVVAPVVFFDQNGARFPKPHWWTLEAGVSAPRSEGAAATVTTGDHPLFAAPVAVGGLSARLNATELWAERRKLLPARFAEQRLYALLDAMERRARISGVEFTEITGEPERRMGGFATQAGFALNVDGAEVLVHDREQRRLVLDLELLMQIFEVKRGGS